MNLLLVFAIAAGRNHFAVHFQERDFAVLDPDFHLLVVGANVEMSVLHAIGNGVCLSGVLFHLIVGHRGVGGFKNGRFNGNHLGQKIAERRVCLHGQQHDGHRQQQGC